MEKFKITIFEIPTTAQILNIINRIKPNLTSMILDIIRKFIEYSLKKSCFESTV